MSDPAFSCTLKGVIPGKKNLYRRKAGGGMFIDKALKAELDGLTYEIIRERNRKRFGQALQGPIRIEAIFYVPNLKSDLDNAYTTLQDLLQVAKIVKNDNQVGEFLVRREVDKKHPRVEVNIYQDD